MHNEGTNGGRNGEDSPILFPFVRAADKILDNTRHLRHQDRRRRGPCQGAVINIDEAVKMENFDFAPNLFYFWADSFSRKNVSSDVK